MECIQITLDLFHVTTWEGAHRKHLARGGTWKLTGRTFLSVKFKIRQDAAEFN